MVRQLQKGSLLLQCMLGFPSQSEGKDSPSLLGMDPLQPASESFISITKKAQRVLWVPNDYVEKKHRTPKHTHDTVCSESIWEEKDLCYSWIAESSAEREIENRSDISMGRAQIKK